MKDTNHLCMQRGMEPSFKGKKDELYGLLKGKEERRGVSSLETQSAHEAGCHGASHGEWRTGIITLVRTAATEAILPFVDMELSRLSK